MFLMKCEINCATSRKEKADAVTQRRLRGNHTSHKTHEF